MTFCYKGFHVSIGFGNLLKWWSIYEDHPQSGAFTDFYWQRTWDAAVNYHISSFLL